MEHIHTGLTPEQRFLLARKGQILYGKYCSTRGRGICAENFALHQLRIGHAEIVHDFLRFLEVRLDDLRDHDSDGLFSMTESLAGRVRQHLANEG